MLGPLWRHDLRLLAREGTAVAVLLLTLAAVFYGTWSGSGWQARQLAELALVRQELAAAFTREATALEGLATGRLDPGAAPAAGLPNLVRTELLQAPGPLAALAVGDGDLRPARATVTMVGRADDLFRFYQVENPALLGLGRFDLAFVIVYLVPLLILGLTYNVLSADRESGTLGLLLSQPLTAARVAWTRIGLRTALVAGAVVLGGALALLLFAPRPLAADILPRLGLWSLVALVWCGFWGVIAGFVAARNAGSDSNALLLLLCWATLTLLLPAAIVLAAQTLAPTPSRLEYVTAARAAENAANARGGALLQGYLLDHPELEVTQDSAVAPFIKAFVLVQREVEQAVAPISARFEDRLARQQRIAGLLTWISPASLAQTALAELAGTSLARHRRFEAEARALRADWLVRLEAPLIAGRRLTPAEFAALPRPDFRETPLPVVVAATWPPVLALLVYAGLVLLAARRRFRRFSAARPAGD